MANTDAFHTFGTKDQVNKEEINYILEKAPFLTMMLQAVRMGLKKHLL